jgi:Fe2+ transport system protein FeoA
MSSTHTSVPLAKAPLGTHLYVHHHSASPEVSSRLRELGFTEDATIRCVVKADSGVICQIGGSRIGINNQLAASIFVYATE